MRLRFSRLAEADIGEIGDFMARDNPRRAATFVADLREKCRQLVHFPQATASRSDLGSGVRVAILDRYLILYVVHPDMLEIRRVVHGARDLDGIET